MLRQMKSKKSVGPEDGEEIPLPYCPVQISKTFYNTKNQPKKQ